MIIKDAIQDKQLYLKEVILVPHMIYLVLPEFMKFYDHCETNPHLLVFKKWISKKGEIRDY